MNCKRCGNEIVGEIQRYCNDCKREVNGGPREKKVSRKIFKREKLKVEVEKIEIPEEVRKRSVLATIGYILFMIIIMAIVFVGSVAVGFSIGPVLSL